MTTTDLFLEKNNISSTSNQNPILDFYKDSTILVTGGTGFVGKVLINKLLTAMKVKKIFMLIRVKDNLNAKERLQAFFKESIFKNIQNDSPELIDRVHPIHADYCAPDLAISSQDQQLIIDEVEIVFNVVASVKFNEKLADAIDINVLGTNKIINLTMKIVNLKSFLHISTLYCNCDRSNIKETVYEPEIGYEKIIQLYRILDNETLEKFSHCLIGKMPNTYTMTKKCSENLVNHKAFYLPAGIFRPPIVMSTYKDPFPGWTDNVYGPSGLCVWSARGVVRCIWGKADESANMVPADYCVNAILSCAWDCYERHEQRLHENVEIPVYNYIFEKNNLTWGQYMNMSRENYIEPFEKPFWCFTYTIITSKIMFKTVSFFLHNIPGYLMDGLCLLTGQKRIYTKAYNKISRIIDMMSWFGTKKWKFTNGNIEELDKKLLPNDRAVLEFHLKTVDWREYFKYYLSGIRKYFFKEAELTDKMLKKRRQFYQKLVFLHKFLKTSAGFILIWYMVKIYIKVFNIIPKISI